MNHLLARLRANAAAHTLASTTFYEECGCVRTPTDRHNALRERSSYIMQQAGLFRV